jgi:wyosine [tRNA(Phe)-imidazoG37] synthetase (radical SAM superfamily)
MYKYLFGPVPSRRLGMSLGIDLVPKKVCSLNCVYCEVGRTNILTTERKEYIPFNDLIAELDDFFHNNPDPDFLTFSGSGEPTLNSRIGDVIIYLKNKKPEIPVAVLTNGTLLSDQGLRSELMLADVVLPSLDAATENSFQKINRPAEGLDLKTIIDGLAKFSHEFQGRIWLEVFILPGFNYSDKDLEGLDRAINKINPYSVQLNTLDRPGAEALLSPASLEQMEKFMKGLTHPNVEIIAATHRKHKKTAAVEDVKNRILQTISRRPCTLDDLCDMLNMSRVEINKYIRLLEEERKIETVNLPRGEFYRVL